MSQKAINKLVNAYKNYTLSVQGGAESKKQGKDGEIITTVNAVAQIQIFDADKSESGKPPMILKSVMVSGSGFDLQAAQDRAITNAVRTLGL